VDYGGPVLSAAPRPAQLRPGPGGEPRNRHVALLLRSPRSGPVRRAYAASAAGIRNAAVAFVAGRLSCGPRGGGIPARPQPRRVRAGIAGPGLVLPPHLADQQRGFRRKRRRPARARMVDRASRTGTPPAGRPGAGARRAAGRNLPSASGAVRGARPRPRRGDASARRQGRGCRLERDRPAPLALMVFAASCRAVASYSYLRDTIGSTRDARLAGR